VDKIQISGLVTVNVYLPTARLASILQLFFITTAAVGAWDRFILVKRIVYHLETMLTRARG
jgi:hypothetical protein